MTRTQKKGTEKKYKFHLDICKNTGIVIRYYIKAKMHEKHSREENTGAIQATDIIHKNKAISGKVKSKH